MQIKRLENDMDAEIEGIRQRYKDKIESITGVLGIARSIEQSKLSLIKPVPETSKQPEKTPPSD